MGQLERYGLYVLCVVIFLILGVALWGGDPTLHPATLHPAATPGALDVVRHQTLAPRPERDDVVDRLRREFSTASVRNPAPVPSEATLALAGVRGATIQPVDVGLDGVKAVPAVVPSPRGAREYEVQKNDVLETIAKAELGASKYWRDILAANPGLVPTKLQPGVRIKLPAIDSSVAKPAPLGKDVYVVQKDDVLETIALRHLGKSSRWKEIVAANPGLVPTKLRPGMQLILPSAEPQKDKR